MTPMVKVIASCHVSSTGTIEGISTAEHPSLTGTDYRPKAGHEGEPWFHHSLSGLYGRLKLHKSE
jgi:hypothetical protein